MYLKRKDFNIKDRDLKQIIEMDKHSHRSELNRILKLLAKSEKIIMANEKVVSILRNSSPVLIDIDKAVRVIPGMTKTTILHAGPPISFKDMCGAMKGAIIGAIIYENLAENEDSAIKVAESGKVVFEPTHKFSVVGTMAGVISASMPVYVIKNHPYGNIAYSNISEGQKVVLQHGAYGSEIIERLKYIENEFAPLLKKILNKHGEIKINDIISQALYMGDEGHNRNKAATNLYLLKLFPYLLMEEDKEKVLRAFEFIQKNDNYFVNISMAASKCILEAAKNIEYSTIVTNMCRNGVDFGIIVSGTSNENWHTGPAQRAIGLLYEGYSESDANKDLGDSSITEALGIGGFAMSAAPSIVQCVGGTVEDAISCSYRMYEITESENPNFKIPTNNFKGLPLGIDILKVVQKRILPIINTGISNKKPGIGKVGAGLVTPPIECFEKAVIGFYEKYKDSLGQEE
jgi:hypothetical protein